MSGKGAGKVGQAVAQVKQEAGELVPDYAKKAAGKGSQLKADANDFIVPRVKLLHGTSKEPEQFDAAKVGNFWVNVMDKDLTPSFDFIVCRNRKKVLLMRPMDDKTGEPILARADDAVTWNTLGKWQIKIKNVKNPVTWEITDLNVRRSGLLEFGTSQPEDENSNPAATEFHDYLIYMPEHPELGPALFSLARTAAKRAKALNSKIQMRCDAGGVDMQSLKFKAVVTKEGEGDMAYYNIDFKNNGFASEAELARCLQIADRFVDFQGAGEEEGIADKAPVTSTKRGEV